MFPLPLPSYGFLKLPIITTKLNLRHLSLISELTEAVIFWTIIAWKSFKRMHQLKRWPVCSLEYGTVPSRSLEYDTMASINRTGGKEDLYSFDLTKISQDSHSKPSRTSWRLPSPESLLNFQAFLNTKQHRGHKMIKNCAKSIVDRFKNLKYVNVNLSCGMSPINFSLGDFIQLMQYSVIDFDNIVDLILYRYCC